MNRRQFNQFAARLGAVSLFTPALTSRAQVANFPNKPITLLVAFAPGGPADTMARAVAPGMSTLLGQSVVVENRPGANGKLAMQALLRAPRDGHTLAYISPSIMSIGPLIDKDLGFDTIKDIQPLTTGLRGGLVVAVNPSMRVRNLKELVAYAKSRPGTLNYGSIGVGSTYHLSMEKLLVGLGIEATHIPYKGEAPAITDLISGTINMMLVSGSGKPFLDNGKLVAIAATGIKPTNSSPKTPLVRDSGIAGLTDYDETVWVGFGMARGAPPDTVSKLHGALVKTLESDEVRKRLSNLSDIETCTPEELQDIIRRELTTNRQLIDSGRVKLE